MGLRYSKLKVFHFPRKLASLPRQTDEIQPPLHIRIKPTNVCCHRCRYCAYRTPDLQLGKDMALQQFIPRDKMMEILDDIIAMGVQAVTFSGGGEPFCYPHLLEAARRLAASPVRFAALTNAARLEGETADFFARYASWVRVSMDGWDAESYARYRGVGKDEFGRVLRNIEHFKALGGPCYLGVSYIVDSDNAPHVYESIVRIQAMGADSVKVSPCIVSDQGGVNNAYHAPFFETVRAQIRRAMETFRGSGFEIYDSYHQLQNIVDKPYTWCPYLQVLPVIAADQCVYTCQDKAYHPTGALGSIEAMRFRDFWMNNKDKFFLVDPSRDCAHHCVADDKNRLILEYLEADRDHLGFV